MALLVLGQSGGEIPDVPYRRSTVPGTGLCQFWPTRSFVYTPDAAGDPQLPGDTVFRAIDASFATWQGLSRSCSDLVFQGAPPLPNAPFGYDGKNPGANVNAIIFRTVRCADVVPQADNCFYEGTCANKYRCWDYGDNTIAQTTTTYSLRTGAILDADIELNAARNSLGGEFLFTTVSSPQCATNAQSESCVATDVQNTLTHEIGHTLGFDHVASPSSTMAATAPLGELSKRVIDPGTAQGFCDVYPAGAPVPSCDDTAGQRLKISGATTGTTFPGCSTAGSGPDAMAMLLAALMSAGLFRKRGS